MLLFREYRRVNNFIQLLRRGGEWVCVFQGNKEDCSRWCWRMDRLQDTYFEGGIGKDEGEFDLFVLFHDVSNIIVSNI